MGAAFLVDESNQFDQPAESNSRTCKSRAAAIEHRHPCLAEERLEGRHRNLGKNNRVDIVGKLVDFRHNSFVVSLRIACAQGLKCLGAKNFLNLYCFLRINRRLL